MTGPTIARLSDGGRIWALGAQQGSDRALEALAGALLQRWQRGDKLVVLGNMLGGDGDPGRALDLMLLLRRRLLATNLACDVFFLRGAQEEMWHKLLSLQFAMSPLSVLDWMLARGLMATIEAYGGDVEEGRIACRTGPTAIARWTVGLRGLQMARAGHAELLNSLCAPRSTPTARRCCRQPASTRHGRSTTRPMPSGGTARTITRSPPP